MSRLLFFLSYWLLSAITGFSQNTKDESGGIKGAILTSDGKPAAAVTIQLKGSNKTTLTDDNGTFTFKYIQAGKYEIAITSVGYHTIEQPVFVEDNKTATINFQLSESAAELAEIVVNTNRKSYISEKPSASLRLNAALIEVPQNITVATKQTLSDMGLLTKGEVYRISSGITKSYGGNLDMTVQIRGIDATYGTYRNGVGGPIWWNAQEDAAMIERMEFVKGPAGFMLANGEPGGLINTVTKQPTHQRMAEIGFGIGSWNMMRSHIDLGGEFVKNGKLTYRLNTGIQKNHQYYHFGSFNRFFIAPVLKYDFSKNTSLTLEHNYVQANTQEIVHSSISINGDLWALPIDLAINDPNQKKFKGADSYTRAFLQHKINDNWTFNTQFAYMRTDWDGTRLYLEGISPNKDTLYRDNLMNDWTGKLSNMQLYLDGKFYTGRKAEHKVLMGIDYGDGSQGNSYGDTYGQYKYPLAIKNPVYYLHKDSLKYTGDTYSWITGSNWQALYLQDHLKLFDKFVITLAGRLTRLTTGQDYNNPPNDPEYEITDTKFTPRLGFTYLFSKNLSAYILHDESFLAQRGAIYGGKRLPPLTGSNNEMGVKALLFKKQLSITASVFDIKKNNVSTADMEHPGFNLITGEIRSKGFDLDIAGRINENIYLNANYSYADPKITKDEDKSVIGLQNYGSVKNIGNFWVKYQVTNGWLKGLGIGGGLQYVDKRSGVYRGWNSSEGNKFLPSYTLLDAALSYTTGRVNVNLNAYNLANKKYAANGAWYPDYQEWMFDIGDPVNFRLQTIIRL